MKMNFNELVNKIRASATVAGEYAGKKASEIGGKTSDAFNVGKLNVKLFDLNTDMDVLYKEIGKIIYASHAGEDQDSQILEDKLAAADEKMAEIKKIKEKIASRTASKKCNACGKECENDAAFCSKCGTSF